MKKILTTLTKHAPKISRREQKAQKIPGLSWHWSNVVNILPTVKIFLRYIEHIILINLLPFVFGEFN